jgi:hypothetical protein
MENDSKTILVMLIFIWNIATALAINLSPVTTTLNNYRRCCQYQLAYTWKRKINKNAIYKYKVQSTIGS